MDWPNERYVRVYLRDTPEWLSLSFEAQGVFLLLLRKVDRSGVLSLGRLGRRAVAVAIGHGARWPEIEPALAELEVDGCVEISDTILVIPNYLAAQECAQTDAARQRESRARRRDANRAAVTKRDETSRNVTGESRNVSPPSRSVTRGHDRSHAVTPSLAVPSVPSEPSPKKEDLLQKQREVGLQPDEIEKKEETEEEGRARGRAHETRTPEGAPSGSGRPDPDLSFLGSDLPTQETLPSKTPPQSSQDGPGIDPNHPARGSGQSDLFGGSGGAPAATKPSAAVAEVFQHWQKACGHPGAKLDRKRAKAIGWALKTYGADECKRAIDGCASSPFHRGQNDRKQRFDDPTLIFRDASHVEKFLDLHRKLRVVRPSSRTWSSEELRADMAQLRRSRELSEQRERDRLSAARSNQETQGAPVALRKVE